MRRKKKQEPFSLFAFQDAVASVCGLVVLITLILALELTNQIVEEATAPPPTERDLQVLTNEIATFKDNLETIKQTTRNWNEAALVASRSHFSLESAEKELREAEKRLAETLAENKRLQDLNADQNRQSRLAEFSADATKRREKIAELDQEIARLSEQKARPLETSIFYSSSASVRETPWLVDVSKTRIVARSLAAANAETVDEFVGRTAQDDFLSWALTRDSDSEYFILLFRPSGAARHDDLREALEKFGFKIGVDLVAETQTIEINR